MTYRTRGRADENELRRALLDALDPTDTTGGSTGTYAPPANYLWAMKVTASASGQLQTLGNNISLTGGLAARIALYDHNAGSDKPASLLAEKAPYSLVVGWNDQAPASLPDIVQGTVYWIAVQHSAEGVTVYRNDSGRRSNNAYTYGAFPATWPAGSVQTNNSIIFNLRMTYEPIIPTVTTQPASNIGID